MESKNKSEVGFFQMPLHYPRYTKKDYQDMSEWRLDRLFAEYGLSVDGDLVYKREFAMGAFVWPDCNQHTPTKPKCSYYIWSLSDLLKNKA